MKYPERLVTSYHLRSIYNRLKRNVEDMEISPTRISSEELPPNLARVSNDALEKVEEVLEALIAAETANIEQFEVAEKKGKLNGHDWRRSYGR